MEGVLCYGKAERTEVRKTMKRCFLITEGLLYAAFLVLDLSGILPAVSTGLKFASIALVALAGLTAVSTPDGRTVAAALVLTAAADVFLLVLDAHYGIGVALFLSVQALYTIRLCRLSGSKSTLHLTARVLLAGFAAWMGSTRLGSLEALAAGYITWFFLNLAQSAALAVQTKNRRHARFAAGLALFFLCDLCVGVHNLPQNALSGFADVAMWAFYLPGQVLIALSTETLGGDPDEI